MPISHITLRQGHPAAYRQAISRGLQQALVSRFEVPEADCFQIFHQLEAEALCADPGYLTSGRDEAWLLIEITAGKPRSVDTKRAFYQDLAQRLSVDPGVRRGNLMVVIRHNNAEDWSFGDGIASMLPREETSSC